jgi:hypothetical protein
MRHGKGDKGLFPFGQLTLGKYGTVIIKKLLSQLRSFLADFFEFAKICRLVVRIHNGPPSRHLSASTKKLSGGIVTTQVVRFTVHQNGVQWFSGSEVDPTNR